MPVVSVTKKELWKNLNLPDSFSEEDFRTLCFEFGIELDDVTSEALMAQKTTGQAAPHLSTEELFKIEIPANRYDLLSTEGLCRALNVFRGQMGVPAYRLTPPPNGAAAQEIKIDPSVLPVRPHLVACVLRNMTFTKESYQSFIDLQEKLHQNICRKRTLVSIGTHDLDTLQGPFVYSAQPPKKIKFAPLNETKEMDGEELMAHLGDSHLKAYLPIIRDLSAYPVLRDAKGVVLSLPPIINGDHSKIHLQTKNVLIEVTAVDLHKAQIVLDTIGALFSQYCGEAFTCEAVTVRPAQGPAESYPKWNAPRHVSVSAKEVNSYLGQSLTADAIARYLRAMSLGPAVTVKADLITAQLPPTRTDVLHACDLVEDVAIAFGYNNLGRTMPGTICVGRQNPLNKLSDLLRLEVAQQGYTECLTQSLCSREEQYAFLNKPDDNSAVTIANPATVEFQVCRTTLLPGLLKSLNHNKAQALPLRLFEVSDVMIKDPQAETGARNKRMLCALYVNPSTGGFETVHGLLDRVMLALDVPAKFSETPAIQARIKAGEPSYCLQPSLDSTYLPTRGASVVYKGQEVGSVGILHPLVLQAYGLPFPVSVLQLDIEGFV